MEKDVVPNSVCRKTHEHGYLRRETERGINKGITRKGKMQSKRISSHTIIERALNPTTEEKRLGIRKNEKLSEGSLEIWEGRKRKKGVSVLCGGGKKGAHRGGREFQGGI